MHSMYMKVKNSEMVGCSEYRMTSLCGWPTMINPNLLGSWTALLSRWALPNVAWLMLCMLSGGSCGPGHLLTYNSCPLLKKPYKKSMHYIIYPGLKDPSGLGWVNRISCFWAIIELWLQNLQISLKLLLDYHRAEAAKPTNLNLSLSLSMWQLYGWK